MEVFTFVILVVFCFSYNWPAQTDGVDYGDADEVKSIRCERMSGYDQSSEYSSFNILFFTGSFSPQVFIHHMTHNNIDSRQKLKLFK